jgi:ketosteroid isomerase-like protein
MAAYFSRVFAARRLTFTFTGSEVAVLGDAAVERLTFASRATPLAGGDTTEDIGKGLHVYARQPNGAWKLTHDIWNSDRPLTQSRADAEPADAEQPGT